jgi:hypothetical protein
MTRTRRIAAVSAIAAATVLGVTGVAQASSHHGHGHHGDAHNGPTVYDSHHPGRSGPDYGIVGGLLYVVTHL